MLHKMYRATVYLHPALKKKKKGPKISKKKRHMISDNFTPQS